MNLPNPLKKLALVLAVSAAATSCDDDTTSPITVASVEVIPATLELDVGETSGLVVAVRGSAGQAIGGRIPAWSSDAESIASVDGTGAVTAVAEGTATITATVEGVSGTAAITVVAPIGPPPADTAVAEVAVTPDSLEVRVGYQRSYRATLRNTNGEELSGKSITWSTADAAIATINGGGVVTGVAEGETFVIAESEGVADTAVVGVSADPAASVVIAPASAEVRAGYQKQFTDEVFDSLGVQLQGRAAYWAVVDGTVATVDHVTGLVTGAQPGTTQLVALVEEVADTIDITVSMPLVESVDVTPDSLEVRVGFDRNYTFTAVDSTGRTLLDRTATWTTGDGGIATIDAGTGLVAGVSVGETSVTATVDGVAGSAIVGVSADRVIEVVASPDSAEVRVSFDRAYTAATLDSVGTDIQRPVTWSSLDPVIASIDAATGIATGLSVGEARLVAESEGVADTVIVEVSPDIVLSVDVTPDTVKLTAGDQLILDAATLDPAGVDLQRPVRWSIDDPSIAGVGPDGSVIAVAAGETTARAESEGAIGSAVVIVSDIPVGSVVIAPADSQEVRVRGELSYSVTTLAGDGSPLPRIPEWVSSDTTIATVDRFSGAVIGRAPGRALVTASSGGVADTVVVGVTQLPVGTVTVIPDPVVIAENFDLKLQVAVADSAGFPVFDRMVTWSSEDTLIASVNASSGLVTGVSVGETKIIAAAEGVADTVLVQVVTDPVALVEIDPQNVEVRVGGEITISNFSQSNGPDVTVDAFDPADFDLGGRPITWTIGNPTFAAIELTPYPRITGVSAGTTELIATMEGVADTVPLTVSSAPITSIELQPDTLEVGVGVTRSFGVTVTDSVGYDATVRSALAVSWTSSDPSVATAGTGAFIDGIAPGSATVVASVEGVADTVTVRVPGRLLVTSNRDGNQEIYRVNGDGSNPVRLTNNAAQDLRAAFTPDGNRIIFESNRSGKSQIWAMDPDGGNARQVTSFGGDTIAVYPGVGPDGKIAFELLSDDATLTPDIWMIEYDGTTAGTPMQVTNSPASDQSPAFSPDGTKIAFSTPRDGANVEIWEYDFATDTVYPLTSEPGGESIQPSYSPDGSEVVFLSNRSGTQEIYITSSGGLAAARSVNTAGALGAGDFWILLGTPRFSPDGSQIAFEGINTNSGRHVRIIDADGTNLQGTVQGLRNSFAPYWEPPTP